MAARSPTKPPSIHDASNRLQIKKYPNRRFYDSTRGQNVSLADLHDLIVQGHELAIVDSTTGEDITNQILTQIILERHAPKLSIFPAAILHQIIRTQEQFLGSVLEQFFRQTLEAQRAAHAQWAKMWQSAFNLPAAAMPSAADWTRVWLEAAGAANRAAGPSAPEAPKAGTEVEELRQQISALMKRVDELQSRKK
ncbi:MAG TPA: polyhydroxyalkanoate synthesis regulator DNA-binding domain-containing protein [Phycisphaerae bacterium]|nr:polyhydroxyalkanoate synthesis regulator DNA-binding domain-containing protein [Phycisphaerae bacterium]HRS29273.1 polyhydroxyalkanoate synthesis regulator DNA-binding domain-containing protein [Phycisphaerae bacterium]